MASEPVFQCKTNILYGAAILDRTRHPVTFYAIKNTMKIVVRPATEADIPSLTELFVQSAEYHAEQAPYFFRLPPNDWIHEFFVGHLNNPNVRLLIAERDSKIVGEVRAEIKKTSEIPLIKAFTTLQVEEIVVLQSHRRFGVARTLMAKIEEIAHEQKISQVTLNVWDFNVSAKSLYAELGYVVQRSVMKKDL